MLQVGQNGPMIWISQNRIYTYERRLGSVLAKGMSKKHVPIYLYIQLYNKGRYIPYLAIFTPGK